MVDPRRWSFKDFQRVSARQGDLNRAIDRAESSSRGSSSKNPDVERAQRNYSSAIALADRHVNDRDRAREHAESHTRPDHHVGPCDESCRLGRRYHRHER